MSPTPFNFDLLIEPEDLVPYLGHPQLRVVDLCRSSVYEQLHIPHAIHIKPKQLVAQQGEASGVLPSQAELQALISSLNISSEHHVVVYDDEGGAWAGRLIWNLHCLGFKQVSLLNGGIHAWLAVGLPTTSDIAQFEAVEPLFEIDLSNVEQYRIAYDALKAQVEANTIQLWDCRTREEYTGLRLAARRGGHISGALHFEWSTALDRNNHLKLHSLESIQNRLQKLGFSFDQAVVVYCQSHHRSGLAYVIGQLLNWPIRAYDGAWSEWGNRLDSPISTGEQPF